MGFKGTFISSTEYVDWNSFSVKNINASHIILYVGHLRKDCAEDIKKMQILKSMPNLTSITMHSDDFNIGIFMSELFKDLPVQKEFNLLDDFKNHERYGVRADRLAQGTVFGSMPNSYVQWGGRHKNLNYGFFTINGFPSLCVDAADSPYNYPSIEAFKEIDKIISSFLEIPNLTFIDKVVLVENYLQQNVQFVSGRISEVADGEYVCEDYSPEKYGGLNSIDNVLFNKIGKCNCISRLMMLMLNNPRMNINCRIADSGEHAYCIVSDPERPEESYCAEPTWGISRNPNRFAGTLKASQFSFEYLLIGQDKLSTMPYHDTENLLGQPFAQHSIDRKLILQSMEKLEQHGIKFIYPNSIPLPSKKLKTKNKKNELNL